MLNKIKQGWPRTPAAALSRSLKIFTSSWRNNWSRKFGHVHWRPQFPLKILPSSCSITGMCGHVHWQRPQARLFLICRSGNLGPHTYTGSCNLRPLSVYVLSYSCNLRPPTETWQVCSFFLQAQLSRSIAWSGMSRSNTAVAKWGQRVCLSDITTECL